MKTYRIATVPGDGIGPEVVGAAIEILNLVGGKIGVEFRFTETLAGGRAIDLKGNPLPPETLETCRKSDAVLLGAVGGPKWDHLSGEARPEKALLGLRGGLGLYANLRPATLHPALRSACPLRADIVADDESGKGIDLVVVRELTGGIYFGPRGRRSRAAVQEAFDTEVYSVVEIRRIAIVAFELARKRRKVLTSVDKANILETSRLWREVVNEVAKDYPDVALDHMYVDNAAMQLIRNPRKFDVILTSNMFGDILTDEASMITGSIGMLPSASLGDGKFGLYEPIHGSAPDIAGKGIANPIATILSAAMMLRLTFGLEEGAAMIEKAVTAVLEAGYRTADIAAGGKSIGTSEMTKLIAKEVSGER
jgi:3-isopropylmalate dehydrogenase